MNKMAENAFVRQVMAELDGMKNKIGLVQFKSCKAYYGLDPIEIEWCDEVISVLHKTKVIPIVSYDTVVGFADIDLGVVYEYGKYSATTSKQFTQIVNYRFPTFDRVLVDVDTYNRFTKKPFGC